MGITIELLIVVKGGLTAMRKIKILMYGTVVIGIGGLELIVIKRKKGELDMHPDITIAILQNS